MTFGIQVDDGSNIPPDRVSTVPGAPQQADKGSGANDSGALWWDHDDPGGVGKTGLTGFTRISTGVAGAPGGDTPFGFRVIVNQSVSGSIPVLIKAGNGQPGGMGGKGGPGGRGGDGGNGDDEQPPGNGGQGGSGGNGGVGGPGGKGGNIFGIDIILGNNIPVSLVLATYDAGIGANPGPGGPPGDGGPGVPPELPAIVLPSLAEVVCKAVAGRPALGGVNGNVQHVQILAG